jgi:hypothetical protein
MNTSSTPTYPQSELDFSFTTDYMGKSITLSIVANNDRFSVLNNDKIIGYIMPGEIRHTWYVVDSNFVEAYLVDKIGNRIQERCRLLSAA